MSEDKRKNTSVLIVGAGIIGLASALKLCQLGYKVTIIEGEAFVGTKCSAYNGNIYSPLYYTPLVTFDKLVKYFLNSFSPNISQFKFNVFGEKYFFTWLFNAILLSTFRFQINNHLKSQYRIGQLNEQEFEKIIKTLDFSGELKSKGQQVFFDTDDAYINQTQALKDNNIEYELTGTRQILVPSVTVFDTKKLCQKISQHLKERYNCEISYNQKVAQILLNKDKIYLRTDKGVVFQGDKVVLCNAHYAKYLLSQFQIKLPILPVRGWAMGTKIDDYKLDQTICTSKFSVCECLGEFRLSGGLQFAQESSEVDDSAVDLIIQAFNKFCDQSKTREDFTIRSCLRPLTPDDKCIISKVPRTGNHLYVNVGHGSRGMSHAFGSAHILADVLEGQEDPEFSLKRFKFIKQFKSEQQK